MVLREVSTLHASRVVALHSRPRKRGAAVGMVLLLSALLAASWSPGPSGATPGSPGLAGVSSPNGATGGLFTALQTRVLDTREDYQVGPYSSQFIPNEWRAVKVAGVLGVPADAAAVIVDLKALDPTSAGWMAARPAGSGEPTTTSVMSFGAGERTSNSAALKVGTNGEIELRSSAAIDLNVDVRGYFSGGQTVAGGFVPISGQRVVDSRTGLGMPNSQAARLQRSVTVSFDSTTSGGQVPNGATSVAVNILVSTPTGQGHFKTWATGTAEPGTAQVFDASSQTSIGSIMPIAADGRFQFSLREPTSADITVDITGYFTASGTGGGFTPSVARLLDTRTDDPIESVAPDETVRIDVANYVEGVLDEEIGAVAVHLAAQPSTDPSGYLTVWPEGAEPSISTLRFDRTGRTSNTAFVGVDPFGFFRLRNHSSGPVEVIVDIDGWFAEHSAEPPIAEDPDDSLEDALPPTSTQYSGVDSYELEDLEIIAADEGTSVAQAAARWGWSDEFAANVEAVSIDHTTFSYAVMNPGTANSVEVGFKGSAPNNIEQAFSDLPAEVAVNIVENEPYSESEISDMTDSAYDAVAQQLSPSAQITVGYDREEGVMSATAFDPEGHSTPTTALKSSMSNRISNDQPTVIVPNVEFEWTADGPAPAALRGGARIGRKIRLWLDSWCTGGFSVITRDTLQGGLLTARHCANNMNHYSYNEKHERKRLKDASRWLPRERGDIQFHEGNGREKVKGEFYDKVGKTHETQGFQRVVEGTIACVFGRTSLNRKCGKVKWVDRAITYPKVGKLSNLAVIVSSNYLVRVGDSGGPVSWGGHPQALISGTWCRGIDCEWNYGLGTHTCYGPRCYLWTMISPIDEAVDPLKSHGSGINSKLLYNGEAVW